MPKSLRTQALTAFTKQQFKRKNRQSLLDPRNLFHISSSDLDIQEGQHVQTSDLFKFAFLIQTHTRKWLQWLKVTPPWQVLGYLPGAY